MIEQILEKYLPRYIRFRPSWYWLAMWSSPDLKKNESHWQALRITIRKGHHHTWVVFAIKKGII